MWEEYIHAALEVHLRQYSTAVDVGRIHTNLGPHLRQHSTAVDVGGIHNISSTSFHHATVMIMEEYVQ